MDSDDGNAGSVYALIVLLLLMIAATLLYLNWRMQGEIDYLHERVGAIDGRPVARILRAHDDATAEAAAREGA